MEYGKRALELYNSGYNCAQAVACAFCGAANVDFCAAAKIAAPFGQGITTRHELCGAVSGMCMAVGMICAEPCDNPVAKSNVLCITHNLVEKFRQRNGSIVCKELLERQSGPCAALCPELVEYAVEILADEFKRHKYI